MGLKEGQAILMHGVDRMLLCQEGLETFLVVQVLLDCDKAVKILLVCFLLEEVIVADLHYAATAEVVL